MSNPWFGPKTYGFGLSPKSREGWIATVIFAVAMLVVGVASRALHVGPVVRLGVVLAMIAAFVAFAVWKSDRSRWRWRWGRRG